jgi:hypothetical protein
MEEQLLFLELLEFGTLNPEKLDVEHPLSGYYRVIEELLAGLLIVGGAPPTVFHRSRPCWHDAAFVATSTT